MADKMTVYVTIEQVIRNVYPVSVTEEELADMKKGNSPIIDQLSGQLATDKYADLEEKYWIETEDGDVL